MRIAKGNCEFARIRIAKYHELRHRTICFYEHGVLQYCSIFISIHHVATKTKFLDADSHLKYFTSYANLEQHQRYSRKLQDLSLSEKINTWNSNQRHEIEKYIKYMNE